MITTSYNDQDNDFVEEISKISLGSLTGKHYLIIKKKKLKYRKENIKRKHSEKGLTDILLIATTTTTNINRKQKQEQKQELKKENRIYQYVHFCFFNKVCKKLLDL